MEEIVEVSLDAASQDKFSRVASKFGYPNLYISLQDAYDDIWYVVNKRTNTAVFRDFGDGAVRFQDDKIIFYHSIDDLHKHRNGTEYKENIRSVCEATRSEND